MGLALFAVASVSALSGCRFDSKFYRWMKPQTLVNLQARLDPNLTSDERAAIVYDAKRISDVQVQAVPGSLFDLSFGSTDMGGVVRYLDERVNLVVSKNTALEKIVVPTAYEGERELPSWMQSSLGKSGAQEPASTGDDEPKGFIIAMNPGGQFWLMREMLAPQMDIEVKLGNLHIPLNTSRIGLMQLGDGYVARKPDGQLLLSSMERIATLVHEGRHSDCTGGLEASDLERVKAGFYPSNPSCLHLHVPCPEGHVLAGLPACDGHAWGAYTMGTIFSLTVAKQCTNCTEDEIQGALIDAADSIDRIIPLEDMMEGRYGLPDMSSSGVRRTQALQ